MFRKQIEYLREWKTRADRKPLIVRGARQVGKTWLVRQLGTEFENYIEINFDGTPEKSSLFKFRDVNEILLLLEADFNTKVIPYNTLIFLDEIQSCPEAVALLRYFYEKRPDIHVIAAGSLLEFLFSDHNFSMPVGRIEFLYMNPLTFEEFLIANGENGLFQFLQNYNLEKEIPDSIHQKLLQYLKHYSIIGGMPQAVSYWVNEHDLTMVSRCHSSILTTYQADFSKYGKNANSELIKKCLRTIPSLIGTKIKYVNIDKNVKSADVSKALEHLFYAGLIILVYHTDGNGLPLGATISKKIFKAVFLDVGLFSTQLSLRLSQLCISDDLMLIHTGALAEQLIGQTIFTTGEPWWEPELFYWHREERNSSAEIDYLTQISNNVVPIEVKAGKTGTLRSLHIFVHEKKSKYAIRFNTDLPSVHKVNTAVTGFENTAFTLLSLPLYLCEQRERLLNCAQ